MIQLHPQAPPKPQPGQPCNGCGVCCTAEPCPAGMLVSRRRSGRCAALVWVEERQLYRCGLIERPSTHLPAVTRWLAPIVGQLARRYVSAGSGCDCDLEVGGPGGC